MSSYYRNEEFKQEVAKIAHKFGVLKQAFFKDQAGSKGFYTRIFKNSKISKYLYLGNKVSITQDLQLTGMVAFDMFEEGKSFEESYKKYFMDGSTVKYIAFVNNDNIEETECDYCDSDGDKECEECHGNRTVSCTGCEYESGRVECFDCNGDGYYYDDDEEQVECENCAGDGDIDCGECDGDGTVECDECAGDGYIKCDDCGGDHITDVECEFSIEVYLSTAPKEDVEKALEDCETVEQFEEYCEDNEIEHFFLRRDIVYINFLTLYGVNDESEARSALSNQDINPESDDEDDKKFMVDGYGIPDSGYLENYLRGMFY